MKFPQRKSTWEAQDLGSAGPGFILTLLTKFPQTIINNAEGPGKRTTGFYSELINDVSTTHL